MLYYETTMLKASLFHRGTEAVLWYLAVASLTYEYPYNRMVPHQAQGFELPV